MLSNKPKTLSGKPTALPDVINLAEKLTQVNEYWHPHQVAALNRQAVKLAKIKGTFDFHHHENEDELFLVVKGQIVIEFETGSITLGAGEVAVVPRGMVHRPIAEEEAHILLFEPLTTLNTGNVVNDRTVREIPRL